MTLRIGFLASHNGSSMKSILAAISEERLDAVPTVVISNNPDSGALQVAMRAFIPAYCFNQKRCGSHEAVDEAIAHTLTEHHVDLVVLSGYMKQIGPKTLAALPGRILNIHPSLLPYFGGPGMYGLRVHAAVIEAGVEETGATVHVVDELYDHGRILGQVRIPVLAGDTPELLRARLAHEEGHLFVGVLQRIADGDIVLDEI
ncbi:phosphoribosylglycinamide formyltransferase [Alicyclobacillus dauci]|uniref:Phosphoribosylglycinamide formyltransferase n=1 Tax=Alicyclobacillus dauci TaxID=1475485 RepID=A0ABY6Z2V9_9BACL|nr:phosphoribosylglycinamide formyltransferase [Alicyclobacillus dauci]WAH36629.1 phosphoribosylglycinamide formyltransferase [Alicyclobacillus dauci]